MDKFQFLNTLLSGNCSDHRRFLNTKTSARLFLWGPWVIPVIIELLVWSSRFAALSAYSNNVAVTVMGFLWQWLHVKSQSVPWYSSLGKHTLPDSKIHGTKNGPHLDPVGPRWAPCWPYEPCYLGCSIRHKLQSCLTVNISCRSRYHHWWNWGLLL